MAPSRRSNTFVGGIPLRTTLLAALLLAHSHNVSAVEIQYDISGNARFSDNIGLADQNQSSDILLAPRISFDARQAGASLELRTRGNFEYLYFVDKTFENQARGEFIGEMDWTMAPERAHFLVQDYLSRELVSTFDSPTSANEQLVNVLVAGPSFHARFNEATQGQLDLRYAIGTAQKSKDFDSTRHGVAGRIVREIGAQRSVSANFEASRVDYATAQPAFDYTRKDAYLGYERQLASIDLNADVGYSWLTPRSGGVPLSGPLVRADVDWRVAPRSLVAMVLAYQISDATQNLVTRGSSLEGSVIGDLINTNPAAILTPELFRTRRGDVRYVFTDEGLTVAVRTYFERLRYVKVFQFNETSLGTVLDLDYQFRPRWTLAFQLGQADRKFNASGREDKDLFMSLTVANQMTRHWIWSLGLIRRQRDSNELGRDYEENAAAISLTYRR